MDMDIKSSMTRSIDYLVKLAMETLVKNQDVIVAKFILENPEIKAHEIELVQVNEPTCIRYFVRKKI